MKTLQIGDVWLHEMEGGLGRYFYDLLRHLPQVDTGSQGLVVGSSEVARSTQGRILSFAERKDSLGSRMLKLRYAAKAQLRDGTFHLVATHFAPYALPLLGDSMSQPMVVHFHGPWAEESRAESTRKVQSHVKAAMERLVYSRAQRLIVLSRHFKQELVERYRIDAEKVRVVPGGVDTDRFNLSCTRAEARLQLGWPADRPILLSVRRQVKRMGLEELIAAARLLVQRQPDVLLLLGGSGPLAAELQLRIDEAGLQHHVRLLGRIDDTLLPLAYRAADMTVVPSRMLEGFGLITLESLAAGTPVYVTAVGGLPEIVQPFAPACIFEDPSPATMAASLHAALVGSTPPPSQDACRAYAVDHFSWPSIALKVRGVYDEVLA